jgi:histidinol-phosphate aminotransferase
MKRDLSLPEWHGGPDAQGVPRWDFSTNANACGPAPMLLQALAAVDARHYPDPDYTALREQLADLHGVAPQRVLLAASASEFIGRMTTAVALAHPGARVQLPLPAYGDYARAALAHDLNPMTAGDLLLEAQALREQAALRQPRRWSEPLVADDADEGDDSDELDWDSDEDGDEDGEDARAYANEEDADGDAPDEPEAWPAAASPEPPRLMWHTEPGSPLGEAGGCPRAAPGSVLVVDRAYAPLQLDGLAHACPPEAWQLWTPNKALGLTGVRGAYVIAPAAALQAAGERDRGDPLAPAALLQRLNLLAPSWPLGADGVALLGCWAQADTLAWVHACLPTLRLWKQSQLALYAELGWRAHPSTTPFGVVSWPQRGVLEMGCLLPALRQRGIKLRDTTSMGLAGWARLSVQPPEAQQALRQAWLDINPENHP